MTEAAKSAVAVRALRKSFGATLAVDDVSFTIEQGTAHALLGENGAGKSTIVKLLSGLIEPNTAPSACSATRCTCVRRAWRIATACRRRSRK